MRIQIPLDATNEQVNRLLRGDPLEEPVEQPVSHGSADGGGGDSRIPVDPNEQLNEALRSMSSRLRGF